MLTKNVRNVHNIKFNAATQAILNIILPMLDDATVLFVDPVTEVSNYAYRDPRNQRLKLFVTSPQHSMIERLLVSLGGWASNKTGKHDRFVSIELDCDAINLLVAKVKPVAGKAKAPAVVKKVAAPTNDGDNLLNETYYTLANRVWERAGGNVTLLKNVYNQNGGNVTLLNSIRRFHKPYYGTGSNSMPRKYKEFVLAVILGYIKLVA